MGQRIAVITDSSACLPAAVREQFGIRIVPLSLVIGEEVIPDGSNTAHDLFGTIDRSRSPANTAAPPPGDFFGALCEARRGGAEEALCLTLSAGYSGTFTSAEAAAAMAAKEMPGFAVEVVDTGALALAHGFAVLAAARGIATGKSAADAAKAARQAGARARIIGVLDTVRYAVKGGRVPRLAGLAVAALRIKPVMALDGGRPRLLARPRTAAKAVDRMLDVVPARPGMSMGIMHCGVPEQASALAGRVDARFAPVELLVGEVTSVMAVHTGPAFIGLAYCDADD
jgi:DegV family protein with EDD domain